jgi:alkanesulfonate monooxygenase SsuD/methylene tetrahydromethanopterin reductase-like flavin-dependent oxidoreductase (luciferase family)
VIVLPLHNPVLVAEEVAMLDVLSGGRMEVGVGSGYQRQEFEGLGIDINESRARFREAVEVMIKAWTEETLTYHGKFTDVENIWVLPKPIQNPIRRCMWQLAPVQRQWNGPPAAKCSPSWVALPTAWGKLRMCSRCGATRWTSLVIHMRI